MKDIKMHRRQFLATVAAGAAVLPLSRLVVGDAQAADLPHVTMDDPTAKAVGYVEDAGKIDAKKETMFKAGSHCAVCALYSGAATGYGPCAIFPGKAVSAKGWCRSFTPKV